MRRQISRIVAQGSRQIARSTVPRATQLPALSFGSRALSVSFPRFNDENKVDSLNTVNPTDSEEAVKAETIGEDPLANQAAADDISTRVFVGNLPWSVDEDWLRDELYKSLGTSTGIKNVRVARASNGNSKGFGFVEFENADLCQQAQGLNESITIEDRSLTVRPATASPPQSSRRRAFERPTEPRNLPSNKVYVGNLPWTCEPDHIQELFAPFGEIKSVRKLKDRATGRDRGVGWVEFARQEDAERAVQAAFESGVELQGRILNVDYARLQ